MSLIYVLLMARKDFCPPYFTYFLLKIASLCSEEDVSVEGLRKRYGTNMKER